MIERNDSYCKYVQNFTHHVGGIGSPNRRTVFVIRILALKASTDLNKKKMLQADVSFHVKKEQVQRVRNMKGKTAETHGLKFKLKLKQTSNYSHR
jgi:hypothetical protein